MDVKIKMRQNLTFTDLRKFNTTDISIKCLTELRTQGLSISEQTAQQIS